MAMVMMLLASGPDQPEGDLTHRLDLVAPLTPQAQLDEVALAETPGHARRTTPDGHESNAELSREDGAWVLRGRAGEDSALWTVDVSILRPGEYLTLTPAGQDPLIFRVVDVQPDPVSV